jgi:hypothetical protein
MFAEILTVLLLIVAVFQGIVIPILAESYASSYFVCAMCTVQYSIFLIIMYGIFS